MKWLLDEMLPPAASTELQRMGHDAVSVSEAGLTGAEDRLVYEWAVRQRRLVVTENFADYATILRERLDDGAECVPVVFVRRQDFPKRGALATHLARHLATWANSNPDPVTGIHWP